MIEVPTEYNGCRYGWNGSDIIYFIINPNPILYEYIIYKK